MTAQDNTKQRIGRLAAKHGHKLGWWSTKGKQAAVSCKQCGGTATVESNGSAKIPSGKLGRKCGQ